MKKICIVLICLMFVFPTIALTTASKNTTIFVDDDGNADYKTIQEAIEAATEGDTIFVYSGMYHENIEVDKSLIINGEDKVSTIINGESNEDLIKIFADGVTLSGFTIQQSMYKSNGINIYSNYNIIENNIIQNNQYDAILLDGLYESGSFLVPPPSNNIIRGNIIRNNRGKGISMWGGDIFLPRFRNIGLTLNTINNTITKNVIENNHHGVYLAAATSKTSIILNEFNGNNISVAPMYSRFNTITKNNFFGSDPFFQSGINEWDNNYWGEPLDDPKQIVGRIGYFGIIPWVNYDENPAQEPFDIGGDEK
jgi:nitrous oxidase accessory protein